MLSFLIGRVRISDICHILVAVSKIRLEAYVKFNFLLKKLL